MSDRGYVPGDRAYLEKDRAPVELNRAVLHSFRERSVQIVDHHTVTRRFVTHERREPAHGRITPADPAWIVPPLSASATPVFQRPYAATELRPNFYRQPALSME